MNSSPASSKSLRIDLAAAWARLLVDEWGIAIAIVTESLYHLLNKSMTPKKRHLLDILRDESSIESSSVPSDAQFRPKINLKAVAMVFLASCVFYFSYKYAVSENGSGGAAAEEHSEQRYYIKAFSSTNLNLARKYGTTLKELGYNVLLASRSLPSEQEVVFEVHVGDESSQDALIQSLAAIKSLVLDGQSGEMPFSNAEIALNPNQ
jgi:hypothetical protein